MPHRADEADQERTPAGWAPTDDAPVKIFRKLYNKYLYNYQGYVELSEKLYRAWDNDEVLPRLQEREWKKRLGQVKEDMERSIAGLDILE